MHTQYFICFGVTFVNTRCDKGVHGKAGLISCAVTKLMESLCRGRFVLVSSYGHKAYGEYFTHVAQHNIFLFGKFTMLPIQIVSPLLHHSLVCIKQLPSI